MHVSEVEGLHPQTSGLRHVLDGAVDLLAGTAGGTACVYVGQPLDTVKVKMQTFPALYGNGLRCFTQTLKQDGIARGLYAGTVPALAANIAENAILFAAYGYCQKVVAKLTGRRVAELRPVHNACAGSLAAIASSFALCPTELVKCRLQAMREVATKTPGAEVQHISPWRLTRNILRTEGVRGLFHGLVPTLMREVPGYFFFFGGYELTHSLLCDSDEKLEELDLPRTFVAGGVAGVSLWTAIFPADVVKSRAQIGEGEASKLRFDKALVDIVKTEGIRGLYKGLGPTLIRSFFATGALFIAFEVTKKSLHNVFDPFVSN